jgi:hypothetical protein
MTTVLRNTEGLYLTENGRWSSDFSRAKRFGDTPSAVRAKVEYDMDDGELVIVLDSLPSPDDVILTLAKMG